MALTIEQIQAQLVRSFGEIHALSQELGTVNGKVDLEHRSAGQGPAVRGTQVGKPPTRRRDPEVDRRHELRQPSIRHWPLCCFASPRLACVVGMDLFC